MQPVQNNTEVFINRELDSELSLEAEHELNRSLIREPEMMRLRDDYQKIDALASTALDSIRSGAEIDLDAVFDAAPVPVPAQRFATHRSWLMIPGAIAAALLAMVIPDPGYHGQSTTPLVMEGSDLYSVAPESAWGGTFNADLARPVSTVPTIRSQTGRDVIGVVGDDGNLYWIEVEKQRTERWPAGASRSPDSSDSM